MAAISTLRQHSLDYQRSLHEREKLDKMVQIETERLQAIVQEWTAKRDALYLSWHEAKWHDERRRSNWYWELPEDKRVKIPAHPLREVSWENEGDPGFFNHPKAISEFYVNYDKEFNTRVLSPCFMKMIADHLDFLSPTVREMIYGPKGYINVGFPVEGALPRYEAWPEAKPLTKGEKERLRFVEADLAARKAHVDLMSKLRTEPYAFEDGTTTERCYQAVEALFAGPHAIRVNKGDIPPKTWIWPFFGYYLSSSTIKKQILLPLDLSFS